MQNKKSNIIIKFNYLNEQTVGEITKIIGLVEAKFLIPIIDNLDLQANPRSAKTGSVTDAIQESIEKDSKMFPFKTKGILLAASQYERMERNRIKISIENPDIEGILDGGHNTLAIGLHILKRAINLTGKKLPKSVHTWNDFKDKWQNDRDIVEEYIVSLRSNPENEDLRFFVPIELLVPRDIENFECMETFKNSLLEICEARNHNVELDRSATSNQKGYFDTLKDLFIKNKPTICDRIEWKTNDGGDVKAQDIIALSWIPLSLITPVKDENGKIIEPVAANKLYSGKGSCLKQFEKLMSSPDVTMDTSSDYKRELKNVEVCSAFEITVDLPEIYDYIYKTFPCLYNSAGGSYGRITAVKTLNEKRKDKRTPFTNEKIDTLSPEGFIVPLVYGLQALMEKTENKIKWTQPPMEFLTLNLEKIVEHYYGIFSMCDYDPQKVGKNPQSYKHALDGFKMAVAGIL